MKSQKNSRDRVYRYVLAKPSELPEKIPEPPELPKMRRHWWQFWRPKYIWMQATGRVDKVLGQDIDEEPPKGRVTKVTSPPQYTPDPRPKRGGRVTRTMPRQLREIKEGQENVSI